MNSWTFGGSDTDRRTKRTPDPGRVLGVEPYLWTHLALVLPAAAAAVGLTHAGHLGGVDGLRDHEHPGPAAGPAASAAAASAAPAASTGRGGRR